MRKKDEPINSSPFSTVTAIPSLREHGVFGPFITIGRGLAGSEDLELQGSPDLSATLRGCFVIVGSTSSVDANRRARTIDVEGEVKGNGFGNHVVRFYRPGHVPGNAGAAFADARVNVRSGVATARRSCCRITSLVLGALLLLPAAPDAQSLAALAKQERERRKSIDKPGRTITERELTGFRRIEDKSNTPTVPPSPAVAPSLESQTLSEEEPESLSEEEVREDRRDAWRQMLQNARDEVARFSAEVDQLQTSLNDLSGLYGSGRANRISRLEKAKEDLAASRRVADKLEDVGRRQGYR